VKTIVISNRKGGSAKSTTAVNLAAELSKEHSVLLLDFDTQGHASIGVGAKPVPTDGLHSIFTGTSLSSTFIPTVLPNLTLSPALEFFDVYEFSDLRGVLRNKFKREKIKDFFDYCIIDTAPTYDALLKNALEVADAVLIPVVPHYLGIVGIGQMIRAIYQMITSAGGKDVEVGILPVMYNTHLIEHRKTLKKIEELYGKEKLFSPIGHDILLAKQFELQIPLVLSDKRSRGQKDYKIFTQEVKRRIG
jgi:chromosome partitioning protein